MSASNCPNIVLLRNSTSRLPILKGFYLMGVAVPVSMVKRSPFAGTARSYMLVANTSATESSIWYAAFFSSSDLEGSINMVLLSIAYFNLAARMFRGASPSQGSIPYYYRKVCNSSGVSPCMFSCGRAAVPMSPALYCCGRVELISS